MQVNLFRKLKTLRTLINALISAVSPVLHALAIVLLVTSVFAVISTDLFRFDDPIHFGIIMAIYSHIYLQKNTQHVDFHIRLDIQMCAWLLFVSCPKNNSLMVVVMS